VKRDNESNIRQIRDRGDMAAMLVFVFQSIDDAGATITTTYDSVESRGGRSQKIHEP
jgi:hypothetical protein